LGSVWTNLMVAPDQAAHVLGKLMLYLGEDNVVWGTDCIWTGSPQPLIEAFWAFTIPKSMQETYGYPALTEQRKRKILGLNGAAVFGVDPDAMRCRLPGEPMAIARAKLDAELGPRRWMLRPAPGPRTRREFVRFLRSNGGPG
ncbi:MAG TPA: amidohydrolase family protein, partial [Nannocystaceae bacterium]|nr:amidohydrolase family protein [Nannocystaceae bacterium]